MREHLSALELLLQAVLVVTLQLLHLLADVELPGLQDHGHLLRLLHLLLLLLVFLLRPTPGIGQVIEPLLLLLLLAIAIQLHLPFDDLLEIATIRVVLLVLLYRIKRKFYLLIFSSFLTRVSFYGIESFSR